jgi:hypothetical protein
LIGEKASKIFRDFHSLSHAVSAAAKIPVMAHLQNGHGLCNKR